MYCGLGNDLQIIPFQKLHAKLVTTSQFRPFVYVDKVIICTDGSKMHNNRVVLIFHITGK